MAQRAFSVGDLIPGIVILSCDGDRVDLGARELAGVVHVLAVAAPADVAAIQQGLSTARRELDAMQAITAMIASRDAERPAGDWPIQLVDPEGALARGFQVSGSALLVIDPVRRLAANVPWDDGAIDTLLTACRAIDQRTRPDTVEMQAPVLVIPQVFEPAFCARLIDYWVENEKQENMVSSARTAAGERRADTTLKRRVDAVINDLEVTKEIAQRLGSRVGPMIWKGFRTVANGFETFRIGCYTAEDRSFFGRHWDNTTPGTAHRKLAMVVNLNADDYEGGGLMFPEFGHQRFRAPTGAAVIFSCALLHEALPVTAGRRYGLFGFFHDEAGAKQLKERIAAEQNAVG